MDAKGHNGRIELDGQFLTIHREGFLARTSVGKGQKRIPVSSITAVQWKPAGPLINGYIQFVLPGGIEVRSKAGRATTDASRDENSVIFTRKQMPQFEQLRRDVEAAIGRPATVAPSGPSAADELAKLADLLDRGALTAEEFQAQKTRLLSN